MTDAEATTATATDAGPLGQEFAQRGLELRPVEDLPAIDGPLSAVGFAASDSGGEADGAGATVIAAAVTASDGHDLFDHAVAAIQATRMDLSPATAVSIASAAELAPTVLQPNELLVIAQGGSPIGVVVRHRDRRGSGAAGDTADAGLAGAAPGAAPAAAPAPNPAIGGLGLLQDVVLDVTVELGRTRLPLARLMNLGVGSVVELDRSAGAPVDVRVNGTLFARGEVVVVDNEYAVRILEIIAPPGG